VFDLYELHSTGNHVLSRSLARKLGGVGSVQVVRAGKC